MSKAIDNLAKGLTSDDEEDAVGGILAGFYLCCCYLPYFISLMVLIITAIVWLRRHF